MNGKCMLQTMFDRMYEQMFLLMCFCVLRLLCFVGAQSERYGLLLDGTKSNSNRYLLVLWMNFRYAFAVPFSKRTKSSFTQYVIVCVRQAIGCTKSHFRHSRCRRRYRFFYYFLFQTLNTKLFRLLITFLQNGFHISSTHARNPSTDEISRHIECQCEAWNDVKSKMKRPYNEPRSKKTRIWQKKISAFAAHRNKRFKWKLFRFFISITFIFFLRVFMPNFHLSEHRFVVDSFSIS